MNFTQGINAQNVSDYQQLKDWYLNNNGSKWGVNWGLYINDPQMQAWTGVTVDLARKFVVKIELEQKNINDTLPNFNMPELEELILIRCDLTINTPTLVLPKLKRLNLSGNYGNGKGSAFPNLQLPELTDLNLSSVRFSGNLPSLMHLSKLKSLKLYSNNLSGALPALNWAKLESVGLSGNGFVGDFPVFNTKIPLKEIIISDNKFTGPLPDLSKCPELLIADLSSNQFSGSIPAFDLKNLTTLNLSSNPLLTSSIPIFVLPKLQRLSLSGKGIDGAIPNFDLPSLTSLSISNTNNTGEIPNFSLLPVLTGLYISNTNNTGEIPNFSLLPALNSITISNTKNTGEIPNFNLPHLSSLTIANIMVSGSIPNFNLPRLGYLTIVNTNVSGSIPSFSNVRLWDLYLYNNQLTGEIPKLKQYTLFNLNLSNNKLTGTIPKMNFSNLAVLNLKNNNLSGPFPSGLDSIKVTTLNIAGNKFSGVIPSLEFSTIKDLFLAHNEFTSFAPTFKSYNLREINVQNNKLTGEIKNILTPNLQYLYLDSNQIKSFVPNSTFNNLSRLSLTNNLIEKFPNITVAPKYNIYLGYNKLRGCLSKIYLGQCCNGGVSIENNPLLPWEGDRQKICDNPSTNNAPCNDNDPNTIDDKINANCECVGKLGIFSSNPTPCPNDTVHYFIKQNLTGEYQWKTIPAGLIQGNDKDYQKVIVKNGAQVAELYLLNTTSNTTVTTINITPYSSSAGEMTLKFLQTAKTTKTINVKHQNSSIKLGTNDSYAYILHEGNAGKIVNQLAINKTGAFALDAAKMKCGKIYYVSYIVGKNLSGFPDLADKCTSVVPKGQAISWLCGIKPPTALAREEESIAAQKDYQINIYPNPTDDNFFIEIPKTKNVLLDLYNIQGQLVLSQKEMTQVTENQYEANVAHLPKGIYLLKMNLDGQVEVRKVIVE